MSSRLDEVIDIFIKESTKKMSVALGSNPKVISYILEDVRRKKLYCSHTFIKGKSKGKVCGVLLCKHHHQAYDDNKENDQMKEIRARCHDREYADALIMSIMETNIDTERRKLGLPPIGAKYSTL